FLFPPEGAPDAYRDLRKASAGGTPTTATLRRARKGARPAQVRLRAWTLRLARDTQDYLVLAELPDADAAREPGAAGATSGKLLSFERPNGNGGGENLRLAEELVGAQQRFQHSLESCAFGVERIDVTGRILYANPIYHEILGYADHELIGESLYQRLLDPIQARARENYVRHIVAMEPPETPLFATYRRKDGAPIRLRLDWSYDRNASGVTVGLISTVMPVAGWSEGDETPGARRRPDRETPEPPEPESQARPGTGDEYSRLRLLQQTLHAARVWASILSHRHPEGEDAQIVSKVDNALDDALRMLGSSRRAPIAAASYYEETAPLQGLVVAVVEPVQVLRDSIVDLLRSWGCNPVGIEAPDEAVAALEKTGRVPDMMIVSLNAAIGLGTETSVVRALWQRYGPGIPCALVAETVAPEIEKFAESVGMRIVRQPVHPIELRSAILTLRRAVPRRRR
ncbi:MAG: PAS domain-containing protein, partial [Gammaproteobacteria bacterium]